MARWKGSSWLSTRRCTLLIRKKEINPASSGDVTQLATMVPTLSQCTESMPTPTAAKPTMAPTMEWVVDTGQPNQDATTSQMPAASSADSMP